MRVALLCRESSFTRLSSADCSDSVEAERTPGNLRQRQSKLKRGVRRHFGVSRSDGNGLSQETEPRSGSGASHRPQRFRKGEI